jgi:enoyl-CoA hydratase/carnithine racemase
MQDKSFKVPPMIMRGLEIWKPFIAAINGMALGGGLEVALACDLRIAAEHARLGTPEVRWSLIPGWGGTQRLARVIPRAKAAEILLVGDPISAEEAYRIGLVNKVVPAAELMPTAKKLAARICENGPLGVRVAKECMIRGSGMSLEDGLRLETLLGGEAIFSEDAQEGVKAFREKRKPVYKAR